MEVMIPGALAWIASVHFLIRACREWQDVVLVPHGSHVMVAVMVRVSATWKLMPASGCADDDGWRCGLLPCSVLRVGWCRSTPDKAISSGIETPLLEVGCSTCAGRSGLREDWVCGIRTVYGVYPVCWLRLRLA